MFLQKLYSAFPSGSPGLGLLLLRGFVALTLIIQVVSYVNSREPGATVWIVAALAFISAACLLIGFLTPVIAVITAVGAIALITSDFPFSNGSLIVLAAAIALLGPGAFSLDARLFGRREILIPNTTRR